MSSGWIDLPVSGGSGGGAVNSLNGLTGNLVLVPDANIAISAAGANIHIGFTGVLPIANGGTNNSIAYPAGSVIFSNGGFLTSDTANFYWDQTNHRLGIGTSTPARSLHVLGAQAYPLFQSTSTTGFAFTTYQNNAVKTLDVGLYGSAIGGTTWGVSNNSLVTIFADGSGMLIGNDNATPLMLGTGNAEQMRIDGAGNIGMGITTPGAKLQVVGGIIGDTIQAGNGASGTFTTVDLKTVTVVAGIITSIV